MPTFSTNKIEPMHNIVNLKSINVQNRCKYICNIAFVNCIYQYFGISIVGLMNGIHRKMCCSVFVHNIVITTYICATVQSGK